MNFELILFVVLLITGLIWLFDSFVTKPARAPGEKPPFLARNAKEIFPVILIVFVIRSFIVEPFKIPSGSMLPTLRIGDFILVNKFTYGIRLPVLHTKVLNVGLPERGDVMVFRYPNDPSLDYIKRVIGLPGDVVEYTDKRLRINGQVVPVSPVGGYDYVATGLNYVHGETLNEQLGKHEHVTMWQGDAPPVLLYQVGSDFPYRSNCSYNEHGFRCTVPAGHYFMMGDNRDASNDSRYWGFVPEQNIVGKAFLIWWNFSEMGRVGDAIK